MIFILILLGFDAYLSFSLFGTAIPSAPIFGWTGIAVLQLLMASQLWLGLVFFRSSADTRIENEELLLKLAFNSMGLISFLFTFTMIRDLVAGASELFGSERSFYGPFPATIIAGLSVTSFAIGALNARFRIVSPRVRVPVTGLPAALEGLRIVQLSDVHLGTGPKLQHVREMVDRALELKPDLIVLTGDIIDGNVADIGPEMQELARLKAPLGSYFVLGNHECYWNHREGLQAMRNADITVLENTGLELSVRGEKFFLAGLNDPAITQFGGEGPKVPKPPADSRLNVVLVHQPQMAKHVLALADGPRYHLQISGHTHGGQFFPWNWVVKWMYPVDRGLGKVQDLAIYVSAGTGYWGPPIRLGTSGEVTDLTLVRA